MPKYDGLNCDFVRLQEENLRLREALKAARRKAGRVERLEIDLETSEVTSGSRECWGGEFSLSLPTHRVFF